MNEEEARKQWDDDLRPSFKDAERFRWMQERSKLDESEYREWIDTFMAREGYFKKLAELF